MTTGGDRERQGEPGAALRELVERNLCEGQRLEAEMGVLARLSPDRRAIVAGRLPVIDALLRGPRTMADLEAAAAAMGTGLRNLYRLMDRMRAVGPVGGLAPGFHAAPARPGRRARLGSVVDLWIAAALRLEPGLPISAVIARVAGRAERARRMGRVSEDFRLPGSSTLHRRIHAERPRALARRRAGAGFGKDVVLDQVALDATIPGHLGQPVAAVATFLLDRGMGLLGGVALGVEDDGGMGLEDALRDALTRRLPEFAAAGVPFASGLKRLTWVVPTGLEDAVEMVRRGVVAASVDADVRAFGPRRHGREAIAILGDRLGRFRFRSRAAGLGGATTGEGDVVPPAEQDARDEFGPDLLAALAHEADEWNARVVARLARTPGPAVGNPDASQGVRAELASTFDPLFETIARRQAAVGERMPPRLPLASFVESPGAAEAAAGLAIGGD